MNRNNIFSIDVEDWYHILDLPDTMNEAKWDVLPSRVENNFSKLLDWLDEYQIKSTCFFLGYIAKRFPHLVKKAAQRGHEIASHGYSHKLVYQMTRNEFGQDAANSKKLLEDLCGESVVGYRAAGFSVTQETPWFFDELIKAGFVYDTSVFPAPRAHGGLTTDHLNPYSIERSDGQLLEFPITVVKVFGQKLCFFGGGYLRFFPIVLVKHMAQRVINQNRPIIFYIHPRDADPRQPQLPMPIFRRFKSYVNLHTTEKKLRYIFSHYPCVTFKSYISQQKADH